MIEPPFCGVVPPAGGWEGGCVAGGAAGAPPHPASKTARTSNRPSRLLRFIGLLLLANAPSIPAEQRSVYPAFRPSIPRAGSGRMHWLGMPMTGSRSGSDMPDGKNPEIDG